MSEPAWPPPRFPFSVQLGEDRDVPFVEVTGFQSDGPVFHPIRMPGRGKVGNVVTLRRGLLPPNAKLWTWHDEAARGTITPRDVVVHLRDDTGRETATWTFHNAWPAKVVSPD